LKGSLRMVALRGHERDDNDIATTREYLIGVAVADVLPPACPIVVGEKVPEREDRGGTPLKHAAQSRPSIGREGVPPPLALLRLDAAAYLRKAPYGESVTMIAVRIVCAVFDAEPSDRRLSQIDACGGARAIGNDDAAGQQILGSVANDFSERRTGRKDRELRIGIHRRDLSGVG
jgi:hypothetical protein